MSLIVHLLLAITIAAVRGFAVLLYEKWAGQRVMFIYAHIGLVWRSGFVTQGDRGNLFIGDYKR